MSSTAPIPTRITTPLRAYLKAYAKVHGVTLEDLVQQILEKFLQLEPYNHGLQWRTPGSHRSADAAKQGWRQLNIYLTPQLSAQLIGLEAHTGLSRAAILYTALFWFAKYMRPPVAPHRPSKPLVKGSRRG